MAAAPQDDASRVTLEAWLETDVGVVREHNEDSAYMEPSKGFFIVADGMGGHAAGEVASAMAVETVRKTLEESHPEIDAFKRAPTDAGRRSIVQLLQSAVLSAHQAVFQRGQNEADKAGMGTTLDVVLVAGPEAFVAHVGDSRTYLIRDGRSSQITTDHTVAEVLVIEGKLTIEEAQVSPLRTILVNAIGVSADVGVEMAHVTLKRGDRLLLCSDGLHDYFPVEEEIAQKLSAEAPGDAIKDMVELAKTRGGHDNITGIVVQVIDVVEGADATIDSDLVNMVDMHGNNPFASDEPTETAYVELPPVSRTTTPQERTPANLKATQPMRIVEDDDATADTIPPGSEPAKRVGAAAKVAAEGKPVVFDDAKTQPVVKPTENKTEQAGKGDAAANAAPSDTPTAPIKPLAASELSTADTGPMRVQPDAKADAKAAVDVNAVAEANAKAEPAKPDAKADAADAKPDDAAKPAAKSDKDAG